MKNVWLLYKSTYDTNKENAATRMYNEMVKNDIPCELKFIEYFSFKNDCIFYKEEMLYDLPKLVFIRAREESLILFFEKHNIRVINSYFCTKYCKDKLLTYTLLKDNLIDQPYTEQLKKLEYNEYKHRFGETFIIKNKFGSQGTDVYLIKNKYDFDNLVERIEIEDYIIQEYILDSYGVDVRAYVIGNQVIGAILRKNENSFMSNIAQGGLSYDYKMSDFEKKQALDIANLLDGEIISVDFLITKSKKLLFCEANSNAGFVSFNYLGYPMRSLISEYIKEQLKNDLHC